MQERDPKGGGITYVMAPNRLRGSKVYPFAEAVQRNIIITGTLPQCGSAVTEDGMRFGETKLRAKTSSGLLLMIVGWLIVCWKLLTDAGCPIPENDPRSRANIEKMHACLFSGPASLAAYWDKMEAVAEDAKQMEPGDSGKLGEFFRAHPSVVPIAGMHAVRRGRQPQRRPAAVAVDITEPRRPAPGLSRKCAAVQAAIYKKQAKAAVTRAAAAQREGDATAAAIAFASFNHFEASFRNFNAVANP